MEPGRGGYRPPYGIFSAATLRAVHQRGWRPMLWSRWGRDWDQGATAEFDRASLELRHPGRRHRPPARCDYYSARGSWARTAAALPLILAELEGRG